ncbi:hypothetical protein ACW5R3_12145 [Bizionia sp. KMM 8389]|uniref:DUF4352 domain-containing protein n=2 Tax=Flavobacteriaceae TaxID=49546 RepID=A0A4Y8APX9_9FLAO|nr:MULTISPECIES: hypothetical protein [Flavobacteriaceae]TEW72629.1 hypothetical protein E2488_14375 [Gramella jeungdoensis]GGK54150.1 hypothetical protein GCM10007963_23050 [Lutibacter litoralis]
MNRVLIILFFISFTTSAQKINKNVYYNYSEDVEFRIYLLKKAKMIDRGSANYSNTIIAESGKRFVSITFEFKNNSSTNQIIDFEKIFIKDKNSELHHIDFVVMAMKMTARTNKLQQTLKPNKKRKISVEFRPSFDKNEIIKTLIINNEIIELEYKE